MFIVRVTGIEFIYILSRVKNTTINSAYEIILIISIFKLYYFVYYMIISSFYGDLLLLYLFNGTDHSIFNFF